LPGDAGYIATVAEACPFLKGRRMQLAKLTAAWLFVFAALAAPLAAAEPAALGSRRELFVDRALIERLEGGASLQLHRPEPREMVLAADKPWEGNTSAYFTIFQDGDRFRMYYRGSHFDEAARQATHREVTCYAESKDGIHWEKPALGLFEFDGSKQNNIVWDGLGTHCFTPFKDENPACPPEAKCKAISAGQPKGLYAFHSPDGIHWKQTREQAVITQGNFDSQNLAFWDPHIRKYREYHRGFRDGVRDILTSVSEDFLSWPEPRYLDYADAPKEHLYTNAIRPYFRAPHLLIGFPTRFLPATEQVEPTFMASRDGRTFHRWTEAVVPLTAPEDREGNRSNYMTWGLVQLPGDEKQLSVYATEAYYAGPASRVRRFVYRVDGFVSLHADEEAGELVTRPFTFSGQELTINFATRAGGEVRVELQDGEGQAMEQYVLSACRPLTGDSLDRAAAWKTGGDVAALAGKPIRLRLQLKNADVYSFQFR
jgi:hypothetical protein